MLYQYVVDAVPGFFGIPESEPTAIVLADMTSMAVDQISMCK